MKGASAAHSPSRSRSCSLHTGGEQPGPPRRKPTSALRSVRKGDTRLFRLLRIGTSPDTLLRMLHRHPVPEEPVPRVWGTGDWAWRKGRAWGTILIDLEKRRPVDVLPDRAANGLREWLEVHPGIEVIARDRSTEYARGMPEGAPEAVQVADRWHLLAQLPTASGTLLP